MTLPGLVDLHVHFRDPGQTEKEDFFTGTKAALSGGFTTVFDMPNNKVSIVSEQTLDEKIAIAKEKVACDVGYYFGSAGDNLEEFARVKNKVFGLKLYLNETTGTLHLSSLRPQGLNHELEKIFVAWGRRILVHAEEKILETVIAVVKETRVQTHMCHIATKQDLQKIIAAKNEGLPITCGVTPHHLFLTEADTKILKGFGKMKPSLKSREDVDFLWKHLSAIDVIESDHAPHTLEEKQSENPPYGVPGLETTLPLLLTAVTENKLTMKNIIRLCYENPKKILGLTDSQGKIEIDTSTAYTINNKELYTKCGWSPFDGWRVKGKVVNVTVRGEQVLRNGEVIAKPGSGHVLVP